MEVIIGSNVRIIMSVAMSNNKKNAEQFLTSQLPQVLDNVVKLSMFVTSQELSKEWRDEIADKHLSTIRTVVNNLVTKKGYLSEDIIEKVWYETFTLDKVKTQFRINSRSPKYKKLTVRHTMEELVELTNALNKYGSVFAKKILVDKLETDDIISADLARIAKEN